MLVLLLSGLLVVVRADSRSTAEPADPPGRMLVGVTQTQRTITAEDSPQIQAQGQAMLRRTTQVQNQYVMGWGAGNPEPRPGVYDWSSLDSRMKLIRQTGGLPVITLCCAPDWMKNLPAGKTDWSTLEQKPAPEHYDDFARLSAKVAARYPWVKHFVVWSEMRGFYDDSMNTWAYADYTDFYNKVYHALKDVSPDIKVGGPYAYMHTGFPGRMSNPSTMKGDYGVVDQRDLDAITYWLDHADGGDFLAVNGPTNVWHDGLAGPDATAVQNAEKYRDINEWIRSKTNLPIWWMEVYSPADPAQGYLAPSSPRAMGSALKALDESGAAVALLWHPEAKGDSCYGCLWRRSNGTLVPTPIAGVLEPYAQRTRGRALPAVAR